MAPRRPAPSFNDEATRHADDEMMSSLLAQQNGRRSDPAIASSFTDSEPTRLDPSLLENTLAKPGPAWPAQTPKSDPNHEEATSISSYDGIVAMERARQGGPQHDERTRAVNIRNDPSISDIDWDLD